MDAEWNGTVRTEMEGVTPGEERSDERAGVTVAARPPARWSPPNVL